MPEAAVDNTWPPFQVCIVSKDGTVFQSFPSKELSGGDADKTRLSDIRTRAAISTKLKFTADGSGFISDDTVLSYYLSLRGDDLRKSEKVAGDGDKQAPTPTVKIDVMLSGFKLKPTPPAVDPDKLRDEIDKLLVVDKSGAAKVGDMKKLSEMLGAMRADSMDLAAQTGSSTNVKEPLDLTEGEWDDIFRNNRALHGWYYQKNILIKARKRAFDLLPSANRDPSPVDESTEKAEVSALPPFYVCDDAAVEVTEMRSAIEKEMAKSGFSSLAIKAAGGGGAMGISATGALAVNEEHSNASKTVEAKTVQALHVAYKFPRATVELDAYCLKLTEEAKQQALAATCTADVDQWHRDFGNVFALNFTLGGELTSLRVFTGQDSLALESSKETAMTSAGLSITSPYVTGGFSVGKADSTESSSQEAKTNQSLRLAWHARGGETLLCSNPPAWTSTVKDHRLWRIMDQETIVNMTAFVKSVDVRAGRFLENPETASKGGEDLDGTIWSALTEILKNPGHPMALKIRQFYESKSFSIDEYNETLDDDAQALKLTGKISWGALDLEQKMYIGVLANKNKVIQI
ncbi:hypothetical protein GGR51DRAFT_578465 [Nemania sp. FL0031]|nr:hypothetical protein GGR51DRAFT_578465 [Nemania sp. FL0031]